MEADSIAGMNMWMGAKVATLCRGGTVQMLDLTSDNRRDQSLQNVAERPKWKPALHTLDAHESSERENLIVVKKRDTAATLTTCTNSNIFTISWHPH